MAQPISHAPDDPISNPNEIVQKKFSSVRRGFDQDEVRSYLSRVAATLEDARAREAEMRGRLGKAVRRADQAEHLTEDDLTARLGEEVAQVIQAAREASRERIEKSVAEATRTRTSAEEDAEDIRAKAQTILDERTTIAEGAAAEIRAEAQAEAEATRRDADATLAQSQDAAVANLEAARREGEDLIHQAEVARSQILGDMDRRRRTMRSQVELLKAGRDRLLQSHEALRRSLDEIGTELKISVAEAKIKGDNAERRAVEGALATPDQLESELADAALIGLIDLPEITRVPEQDPSTMPEQLRAAVVSTHPVAPEAPRSNKVNLPGDNRPVTATEVTPVEAGTEELKEAAEELSTEEVSTEEVSTEPQWNDAEPAGDRPAEGSSTRDAHARVDEPSPPDLPAIEIPRVISTRVESGSHLTVVDRDAAKPAKPTAESPAPVDVAVVDVAVVDVAVIETVPEIDVVESDVLVIDAPPVIDVARETSDHPAQPQPQPKAKTQPKTKTKTKRKPSAMDALFANLRSDDDDEAPAEEPAPVALIAPVEAAPVPVIAVVEAPIEDAEVPTEDADGDAHDPAAEGDRGDEALARVRDSAIADLERTIERRLKRVLADEQNAVMEWVRSEEYDGIAMNGLDDEATQLASYFDAIRPQLEAAHGAGAAFADGASSIGRANLERVETILRDGIIRPIRDRFSAIEAESDADDVLSTMSSFYRSHKTGQIADHASWVTLTAFSEGTLDALPSGTEVRWGFDDRDGACPDGYDNSLGSPIVAGDRFASGHTMAPIDRRCRCVLVPAVR